MVFTMCVAFMPFTEVAKAADLSAGDLIKSNVSSAVYYYDGANRRAFPNPSVYFSWYEDFDDVIVLTAEELAAVPYDGVLVTMRPGTNMIKIESDPKVYAVTPGGVLRWIDSEATASALYGSDWASMIVDVSDAFWFWYDKTNAVDNKVTATTHAEGTLFSYTDSDDIYYVDANGAKRLVSEAGFTANKFNADYVVTGVADTITYTTGTSVTALETGLFPIASGTTVAPPVVGSASVSLSATNPASGTAVMSAARYPMLKVNITAGSDADASVKLRIERSGLSVNADFASISFLDGAKQIGNTKTLNSNNECLSDSIVVPAGTTKTITVAGNIKVTATSAGTAKFSVTEVVSSATVTAALPIAGNDMTLSNAVTLGTATGVRGSYDPNSGAVDKEIGTTAYTFISYKLTASGEDQQVEYIRFTNQGSIAASDLDNVKLYINNEYYTDGILDGDYVDFDFSSNPVTIAKGAHKEFSLVADIIGGSGRSIDFDVDKTTDVAVKGLDFGYYLTPSAALNAGNIVTVSAGTLTISKSNSVAVGNITEGSDEVELGAWIFKAQGEGVEISQSIFNVVVADTAVTATVPDYSDVTNCAVYDESGTVLTGAVDVAAADTVTFTDTISLPAGENILVLKCNLSVDFANDDTITSSTDTGTAASFVVKGTTTGDAITEAPATDITANVQTIKAGSLATYTASTPVAQTLVKGTTQAHFATFILDATGSGEDVKVTQMVVANTPTDGLALPYDLSNVKLYVDGVPFSIVNNFDATTSVADTITYNLSGNDEFVIPKGTTVLVHVMADISASATTGDHIVDLSTITAQGNDTGETITSVPSGAGQAMTLAANGTLTTSLDSSNPDASLIAAGSTGVLLTVLKMEATYEDIELDTIMLTADVTTAASSSVNDYVKLYLYDEDGNKVVETTPTSSVTYTITVPDYVESNGNWVSGFKVANEDTNGAKLYVKADFSSIGSGLAGTSGAQVGWKVGNALDIIATGKESGQGATEAGTANSNTHWVYKSVPTVAMVDLPTTILGNGTKTISKFSVTADAKGDIDLKKLSFTVATTSCVLGDSTIILYDVTGSDTAMNTAVSSGASGLVEIVFTNPRTVSAGQTKTFELRGTISGAGTAGDTVSTELMGDAVFATETYPDTYALINAGAQNDFIWSDMSATSHAITTSDWTNGYLVDGLQATTNAAQIVAN